VGWTSRGRARVEYLGWDLALAPDEAYSYDLFTDPAFRGRRLAAAARVPLLRFARGHGCGRLLSTLLPENAAGHRAPQLLGFRPIGWLWYRGLGAARRYSCRVEPGARRPGAPVA
jgi:RimJ/RimL family protein N-acetyltransferase